MSKKSLLFFLALIIMGVSVFSISTSRRHLKNSKEITDRTKEENAKVDSAIYNNKNLGIEFSLPADLIYNEKLATDNGISFDNFNHQYEGRDQLPEKGIELSVAVLKVPPSKVKEVVENLFSMSNYRTVDFREPIIRNYPTELVKYHFCCYAIPNDEKSFYSYILEGDVLYNFFLEFNGTESLNENELTDKFKNILSTVNLLDSVGELKILGEIKEIHLQRDETWGSSSFTINRDGSGGLSWGAEGGGGGKDKVFTDKEINEIFNTVLSAYEGFENKPPPNNYQATEDDVDYTIEISPLNTSEIIPGSTLLKRSVSCSESICQKSFIDTVSSFIKFFDERGKVIKEYER